MELTVDIPDSELEDAITVTKARTRDKAIVVAITEFNPRMRMAELTRYAGYCSDLISAEGLQAARQQRWSLGCGLDLLASAYRVAN